MNPPLVSIVIPAYNHACYLEPALRSVLAQTYRSIELIVIDDGSTDGTRALLERIGAGFRWESQANAGQARALNRGWSQSRGDVLSYLSADDLLHPEAVEEAVKALAEDSGVVVVYPDSVLIDERSRPVYNVPPSGMPYLETLRLFTCAVGVGSFFRRSVWERVGGWNPDLKRLPDLDFWLRIGLHGGFKRIPRRLAYHRVHAGSESYAQPDLEKADEPLRIIDQLYADPELPSAVVALRLQARASACLLSARLHLFGGRVGHGMARFGEALRSDPSLLFAVRGYQAMIVGLLGRARWRLLRFTRIS